MATDSLGQWTTQITFPAEEARVGPDGEIINDADAEHAADNAVPLHSPETEGNQDQPNTDATYIGTVNGGEPMLPPLHEDVERIRPGPDPVHPLNWRDVCAFIVNKMIGTGIFIQPPAVLLLTRSKGEALGLWILGFAYTLVSMLLYIEFSRKLPHTGGELIYLDETLPTPKLFAYIIYTFYFIFMYNTATNSMQLANQVLISANIHNSTYHPDPRLLRFIAVVALSFFCLLHYFSGRAGRTLNQILAGFKICLLIIVFVAGIPRAVHHFKADWGEKPNSDRSSSATAFLLIVFSFTGWENATFVSGEIANHRILRKGFVSAVLIVGMLYIMVNLVFLFAVPLEDVLGPNGVTLYVPLFFGGGVKARLTWAVLTAISASGSLLSVIYTCARVKQVIGMSNVIPWSKVWKASSPVPAPRARSGGRSELPTPKGGLILHWIFSVILISATARMYNISEAISFPGNLQAYASGWVGIFISIGFPFLFLEKQFLFMKPRGIPEPTQRRWNSAPEFILLRSTTGKAFFTFVYFAFNAYIISVPLIGPYVNGNGTKDEVKGWVYITIVGAIAFAAIVYYYSCFGLTLYEKTTDEKGDLKVPRRTILRLAGVYPKIQQDDVHEPSYGVRRKVEILFPPESVKPSYLYWIFGGSNEQRFPKSWAVDLWNHLMGR